MIKRISYAISDTLLASTALGVAYLLHFSPALSPQQVELLILLLPLVIVVKITTFFLTDFYSQLWCYASMKEGLRLLTGVTAASLVLGLFVGTDLLHLPTAILFDDWLLTLFLVGGSRFIVRMKADFKSTLATRARASKQSHAVIVGAGQAGSALIKQLQLYPKKGYTAIALLDDDPAKKGLMVHGVKVIGNTSMIPGAVASQAADEVILAIPSATLHTKRRLAMECAEIGIPCKTVPDIAQLVDGKASLLQIEDVSFNELLGRKETVFDLSSAIGSYKGKTILVTGAAGSIGSEICRQALELEPRLLIGIDISENGLYMLEEEVYPRLNGGKINFETRVVDVKNGCAVDRLFERYSPEIVLHAAAYKHVPMMERHLVEAIENNLLGTQTMIETAKRHGSERFALISTDKAVNPASYMGLSKHLAERAIRTAALRSRRTKFIAVRFGNVIGSNGSVIPKFKRQIRDGQPITVTHPNMTRYLMTIYEAVHLVMHATAMGNGGEILILDVGEPVRIIDLARSMIKLSGLEPEKDIPIKITGLRPGEKLYEELTSEDESVGTTRHPKIFKVVANDDRLLEDGFLDELKVLVGEGNEHGLRDFLLKNRAPRAA